MKRNVLGVASGILQDVEHTLRAGVVKGMDDDEGVSLAVWMACEPCCDGIACALVVRFIGKVVLVSEIVVKKNRRVFALGKPLDSLPHVTRYVALVRGEFLMKPPAARLIVFNNQDAAQGISFHWIAECGLKERRVFLKAV
jgi:hypothetical protein